MTEENQASITIEGVKINADELSENAKHLVDNLE
jgi:hypothetical protein